MSSMLVAGQRGLQYPELESYQYVQYLIAIHKCLN